MRWNTRALLPPPPPKLPARTLNAVGIGLKPSVLRTCATTPARLLARCLNSCSWIGLRSPVIVNDRFCVFTFEARVFALMRRVLAV